MECKKCGVCCIAPDISTLNKKAGEPCKYLDKNLLCTNYENRPDVCRNYKPCEICDLIYDEKLENRLEKYREIFNL